MNEIKNSLESHIGGKSIIYTKNGFRFECIISEVGDTVLKIHDTKKNYDKIIQLDLISEVDFL